MSFTNEYITTPQPKREENGAHGTPSTPVSKKTLHVASPIMEPPRIAGLHWDPVGAPKRPKMVSRLARDTSISQPNFDSDDEAEPCKQDLTDTPTGRPHHTSRRSMEMYQSGNEGMKQLPRYS